MPLFGAVALFSAFAAARALDVLRPGLPKKIAIVTLILLLVILIAASVANLYLMLEHVPPFGQELLPLLEDHERVMFFSMSADYIYAPLALRMRICGPWTAHWMIPALMDIADPAARERELAAYVSEVKKRIDDDEPEMLLFAPYRQALLPGESLHEIFRLQGLVPRPDYKRVPDLVLQARHPRLAGWIVYERETAP
jgi:hypothetical protein